MKRGSSLRLIEWPMPPPSAVVRGPVVPPSPRPGGRILDRLDDVHVPGAAAEIAGDRVADLRLRRIRRASEDRDARQHHPRRAVAALQTVLLPETLLNRVELPFRLESFDGDDV